MQIAEQYFPSAVSRHSVNPGLRSLSLVFIQVEKMFLKSALSVCFTTSTLAVGANLPCYLVIVKSTVMYQAGKGYTEYDPAAVQQMAGRAGRAGYDTEGKCIILVHSCTHIPVQV